MPAVQLWCTWTGRLCRRHNLFPSPCNSMHDELAGLALALDFTLLQTQADSHESAIALNHLKHWETPLLGQDRPSRSQLRTAIQSSWKRTQVMPSHGMCHGAC